MRLDQCSIISVTSRHGFNREEIIGTEYVKIGNKKRFIGKRSHDCLVFRNKRHFKHATAWPRSILQHMVSYKEVYGEPLKGQIGTLHGVTLHTN